MTITALQKLHSKSIGVTTTQVLGSISPRKCNGRQELCGRWANALERDPSVIRGVTEEGKRGKIFCRRHEMTSRMPFQVRSMNVEFDHKKRGVVL